MFYGEFYGERVGRVLLCKWVFVTKSPHEGITLNEEHIMWRNTMTGETRSYEGWKQWAERFYAELTYDEMGRDVGVVKHINVTMPSDWWARTQKVLRLELVPDAQ